jgi:NAD(P)H-dependent FMN reductase
MALLQAIDPAPGLDRALSRGTPSSEYAVATVWVVPLGSPRIQVILASTRPGRFGERPAAWLMDRLSTRADLVAELIDLRDYPLPIFDQPAPPARTLRDYANEEIARWGRTVDQADGFVVVTPEYNHGYPASLKNALDYLFPELNRKPIAFVGYGNVGGARAIEQLRLVAVEFEMAPLRHAIHILPELMVAAMNADPFTPDLFAPLDGRLDVAATDLVWWASALATARSESAAGAHR